MEVVGAAVFAAHPFLHIAGQVMQPQRIWRKGTDDYFDARLINDGKVYDGRLGVWRSRAAVAAENTNRC